jgi:hypothetical protein
MPREAPLPPQWACLEGRVRYVQRHSAKEGYFGPRRA